jgi:hypothetical protein
VPPAAQKPDIAKHQWLLQSTGPRYEMMDFDWARTCAAVDPVIYAKELRERVTFVQQVSN